MLHVSSSDKLVNISHFQPMKEMNKTSLLSPVNLLAAKLQEKGK